MSYYKRHPGSYTWFAVTVFLLLATLILLAGVAQADATHNVRYTYANGVPQFSPTPTYDPLLKISGKVTDEHGNPMQGVTVRVSGGGSTYYPVTDSQGNYVQQGFHGDAFRVSISIEFIPSEQVVTIPPDAVVNFQRVAPTPTYTATPLTPTPTNTPITPTPTPITPTPVVPDSGFRLDRDAWNFRNRAFVPELKHLVGAFGEESIYTTDLFGNRTLINTTATFLSTDVGSAGACLGFAVTSGLLVHGDTLGLTPPTSPFTNTFSVADPGEYINNGKPYFQPGAITDYILSSFYHQFSTEFEEAMLLSRRKSLSEKLSDIKQNADERFYGDPVVISLTGNSDDCSNHAVLPISYQVLADGRTEVFIYDSNNPLGSNERQSIVFDLANNSWVYQFDGGTQSYGSNVVCTNKSNQKVRGQIDVVHTKVFAKQTTPVWWKTRILNLPHIMWLRVFGSTVTVTDKSGNKLGDDNGTLVENIPDSFVFSPFGQLGANPVSWYVVRSSASLTATVSYNNTPDDSLVVIADKATFDVGLKQGVVATDTLVIDSVANKVSLTGDGERVITTTRLFTNTEQIFTLHFNLDQAHSLSVQGLDNGSLKVVSGTPQQGATLTLEQNGGTGAENYQVTLPPLQPGDAQIVTPNWNNDSVTVGTDVGNNGSIDTTVTVEGEQPPPPALHVYLPLIQKK